MECGEWAEWKMIFHFNMHRRYGFRKIVFILFSARPVRTFVCPCGANVPLGKTEMRERERGLDKRLFAVISPQCHPNASGRGFVKGGKEGMKEERIFSINFFV